MKEAVKIVKGSWLKYIMEFFVIIISIISAIMLDNWHTQRQEYRIETLTLIDISDALSFDLKDLKFNNTSRPGVPLNFNLTPRNPNLFQNDPEYKFYVNYQLVMRRCIYSRYVQTEKNVEEVISMIKAELETR